MLVASGNEKIKQSFQVSGATHGLRVKLDTKVWLRFVHYSIPSLVLSLALVNKIDQSDGRELASIAKP